MMDLVQRSLDAAAMQHRALSNNIANVDTPGYKRGEVVFREKLKKALDARKEMSGNLTLNRTQLGHLSPDVEMPLASVTAELRIDSNSQLRNDGNNVDIDAEMSALAQNTVMYNALAQISKMQFTALRTAITEGRR